MSSICFLLAVTSKLDPYLEKIICNTASLNPLSKTQDFSKQQHLLQGSNERGNTVLQYRRKSKKNLADIIEAKINRTFILVKSDVVSRFRVYTTKTIMYTFQIFKKL